MRGQLRIIVAALVIAVIAIAAVIEPPGLAGAVGYALVVAAMVLVLVRERARSG